jgi:hypothetical protein
VSIKSKLEERASGTAQIKAPSMNITLGSATVLSLAAALTAWKESFDFIFGEEEKVPFGVREGVLIATIAAVVLIVAADMLARAIAARGDATHIVPWGKDWKATRTNGGAQENGFLVAGMRVGTANPDAVEYLLVKEGESPSWRRASEVVLQPPCA